ncbi:MAG: tetratricopeptide repeat protein [Deltaproteobacteria bacterium]|nr:tetratricopeptide repeat protein [Deltaproteobacteria bacterium]
MCPDEAVIVEFVGGQLPAPQVAEIEAHLDHCDACSQVVAGMVSIFEDGPPNEAPEAPEGASADGDGPMRSAELAVTLGADGEEPDVRPLGILLPAGADVGRYRVLECVGVGGMGVVYSAYDPELDRRVALKLLRGSRDDPGSGDRNARLLREAQALAKLSHPNVITVHDVGTWEEQVFMAMEFVDGPTLKGWLESERRSWPEIREVFVAAGRGLAAAHAADLVHRDFKPDNVLIGSGGRVRVTDFGLARWGPAAQPRADLSATDELDVEELLSGLGSISGPRSPAIALTETGTLVGTPAYMAPEQYEQAPADAASDQFAFCVALFEAVYGTRPFSGRTVAELASNVMDGRLADVSHELAVPRTVRQALRRGLSRKRDARFASMDELLAVLDRRPIRPWRVATMVGAPLLAAGAGVWAYASTEPTRTAFCRTERGLVETWSPDRREAIRTAFVATELSYAADVADRALHDVDTYVQTWEGLRALSCQPERSGDEGPGVAALRERCLSRRQVALDTLLGIFDAADEATVRRAVSAVAGLPSVDDCADAELLMAEIPPTVPGPLRDAVEAIRDDIARGNALIAAGRYADGLELARKADTEAVALGHEPLQAETRYLLANLLDRSGEAEASSVAFDEAILLATASRHRRLMTRALVHQVYVLGMGLAKMDEAQKLARRAEAEIEGAGMGNEALSALLLNKATVTYRQGEYLEAAALCRQALALRDREQAPLRWADAAFNLATIQLMLGHNALAIEGLESYVDVFEEALGGRHPEVASGYQNLGVAYSNNGRYEDALRAFEKAGEIRLESLGPEHPMYAGTLNSIGGVLGYLDRREEGVEFSRRSVVLLEKFGDDPIQLASNRADLAEALVELGLHDEAEREANAALESLQRELGEDHLYLGPAYGVLAAIAAARGDRTLVHTHMDRMVALRAKTMGNDHVEMVRLRVERARLLSWAGEQQEALDILLGVAAEIPDPPTDMAHPSAEFAIAEILWDEQGKHVEARKHAERARLMFTQLNLQGLADVAATWLAEHPA